MRPRRIDQLAGAIYDDTVRALQGDHRIRTHISTFAPLGAAVSKAIKMEVGDPLTGHKFEEAASDVVSTLLIQAFVDDTNNPSAAMKEAFGRILGDAANLRDISTVRMLIHQLAHLLSVKGSAGVLPPPADQERIASYALAVASML